MLLQGRVRRPGRDPIGENKNGATWPRIEGQIGERNKKGGEDTDLADLHKDLGNDREIVVVARGGREGKKRRAEK